jgi:hypothetical protein
LGFGFKSLLLRGFDVFRCLNIIDWVNEHTYWFKV